MTYLTEARERLAATAPAPSPTEQETPPEHPRWPDGSPVLVGQRVTFDGGLHWGDLTGQEISGWVGVVEQSEVVVYGETEAGEPWDAPFGVADLENVGYPIVSDLRRPSTPTPTPEGPRLADQPGAEVAILHAARTIPTPEGERCEGSGEDWWIGGRCPKCGVMTRPTPDGWVPEHTTGETGA